VKYQSRLEPGFADEIAAIPGGDKLRECIQCGTCSAVCPLSAYMDHTPRRLIAMTRAGFRDDVLHSTSIWVCASCYACTVECPKEIPITDVMYALRRIAIREGVYPKRLPTPVLAREFVGSVERLGRNNESRLALALHLKTNPIQLLRSAPLGLRLLRRGRMGLGRDSIRQRAQLRTMLRATETSPRRVSTSGVSTPPVPSPAAAGSEGPP